MTTRHSPPGVRASPVTRVRRWTRAPRSRAPLTRACVTLVGSTWPSSGFHDRAQEAARLDERVEPPDLLGPDHLEREADRPRLAPVAPVLVHPVRHRGEPEAPGPVEPDRLPRLRLEPLVELRAGQVDPREVQARVEVRRVAGGVPRRARRQLGPLDQHRVGPPGAREVVEDAGADDAAADDGDAGRLGHGSASSGGSVSVGSDGSAGGASQGAADPRQLPRDGLREAIAVPVVMGHRVLALHHPP